METSTLDLPRLPFARDDPFDIAPGYRALQARQPIARARTETGDPAWLVTGHPEAKRLFSDARLGRSHPEPESAARITDSALMPGPLGSPEHETHEHVLMRQLLAPAFSARRMRLLRAKIALLADSLLGRLAALGPGADLHETLSAPLPILVICELLGVPYADHADFRAWSENSGRRDDPEAAARAWGELTGYMRSLLTAKRDRPGEDILSDLAAAVDRGDLDEAFVPLLGAGLLFAGHQTTVARLDYGTVLLATHPRQRERLLADPARVSGAVEEILRYAVPDDATIPRYAHAEITFAGGTVAPGDAVLLAGAAANRDPRVFDRPDEFDITRDPNPHLSFGHGAHFCLGSHLARLELRTVFGTLFQRFPELRPTTSPDRLDRRDTALTGGLRTLPVGW